MHNKDETLWITCECYTPEHTVNVLFVKDTGSTLGVPDGPELYIRPVLVPHESFFQRLKSAFKYVFFKHGVEGFGEVLVSKDSVSELYKMLTAYIILTKIRENMKKHANV